MASKKFVLIIISLVVGSTVVIAGYQYFAQESPEIPEILKEEALQEFSQKETLCFNSCKVTNEKTGVFLKIKANKENLYLIKFPENEPAKLSEDPARIIVFDSNLEKVAWIEEKDNQKFLNIYDIASQERITIPNAPVEVRNSLDFYVLKDGKIIFRKITQKGKDKLTTMLGLEESPFQEIFLFDPETKNTKKLLSTERGFKCFRDVRGEDKFIFKEGDKFWLYNIQTRQKVPLIEEINRSIVCPVMYQDNIVYFRLYDRYDREDKEIPSSIYKRSEWMIEIQSPDLKVRPFIYNLLTGQLEQLPEITVPYIFGKFMNMRIYNIRLIKNELKFLRRICRWVGPDIDECTTRCFLINTETKEKKDITCYEGVLRDAYTK